MLRLIHDPDLLILDEPTTGVDPLSRRQFWELIDSIRARRPGMSVLVATAYMEEAERFDWLVAMDGGKVIGHRHPGRVAGADRADDAGGAFIRLLPRSAGRRTTSLVIPPRVGDGGFYAIEADGLSQRFGDFTAVDRVSFKIERGEIFGFLGSKWLRQDDDDEDADRPAAAHRRRRSCSARRSMPAISKRANRSATCRSPSRCTAN